MFNIRTTATLILIALTGTLFGCGSGSTSPPSTPITMAQGTVAMGLVRNGTVRIFALNADGSKGVLLKETGTDSKGAYSAEITPYSGPILLEAFGPYTDEATGLPMEIPESAPLRAASHDASGAVQIAVTQLTDLAVAQAVPLTAAKVAAANRSVSDIFQFDILTTQPVEPVAATLYNEVTTQEQIDYTLALAALSQMGSSTLDLSGGAISDTSAATFQQALRTFLTPGNLNNQTGATTSSTNLVAVGSRSATLKLSTAGSASSPIDGIQLTLTLPLGVTVSADLGSGELKSGSVKPSGVAPVSAMVYGKYTQAGNTVRLTIATNGATFGVGEFATLLLSLPAGSTFSADDFVVSPGAKFVGSSTNEDTVVITGISVATSIASP